MPSLTPEFLPLVALFNGSDARAHRIRARAQTFQVQLPALTP